MDKTHGESVPQDVPLTSQVLEYYRDFSQNNELPRYLCGDIAANVHTNPEPGYNYQILKVREDESLTTETGGTSQIFTVNVAPRPPLIGQDHAVPVITVCDANHDNGRNVSPTSSVTSNRKLEWDNGADIGYENCEVANRSLQKSSSLPSLNTLEQDLRKDFQRQSPDGKIADTSQKIPIQLANKSSDTSTDTLNKALKQLTPSTSTITSSNDAKTRKSQSNSTSSALTKCTPSTSSTSNSSNVYITQSKLVYMPAVVITSPLAESTPIYTKSGEETCQTEDYFATPIITHPKKPPRKNPISSIPENEGKRKKRSIFTRSNSLEIIPNLDETLEQRNKYFNRYRKDKIQKLGVTKPISVECLGKMENDNISVGIQTEQEKQQLVFVKQYQLDDKENSPSSSSESSKNIDLNCNSFEYLYGGAIHPENQPLRTKHIEPFLSAKEPPKVSDDNSEKSCNRQEIVENYIISSNLKRSQAKSDLTNVTALTSTLSTTTTKSDGLSSKESNNLIPDVDKSIEILQKLLKTKKYDESTKKYYLKKIVKKLVESKYFDDTQSTVGESTSTSKTSDNSNITQEKSLYPQADSISPKLPPNPKYLKQLTRQTFVAEIPPQTAEEQFTTTGNKRQVKSQTNLKDKIDIYPRIQRNPRFTLTNSEFYVSHNYQPKENLSPSENTSSDLFRPHSRIVFPSCTTDSSLEKSGHCSVNKTSTSTDSRSWREDKTLSEKLLEDKNIRDMSGDFVRQDNDILQFAKRERATQLNWINNEITHLSKLKTLLEKKDGFSEQLDTRGIKPKKSTAVYMITTDPDNKSIDASRNRKRNSLNIPNVISAERKENQFKFKVQHGQEMRDYNLREIKHNCINSDKCSHKNCPYSSTSVPLTRFVSSSSTPSTSYSPKDTNSDDISVNETNNVCKMCANSLKYKYQGSRSDSKQVRWGCHDCKDCSQDKPEAVTKSPNKVNYSLPKSSSAPTSPTSKSRNRGSSVSNPQTETSQGFSTTPPVEFSSQDIFRIPTELQSARLISSEIYTSAECPTTSIRRYVFEIPILDLHKNEKCFKGSESTVTGKFIRPAERDFEVRTSLVENDGKEDVDERIAPESRSDSEGISPRNEEISQGKSRRGDYEKVGPTTSGIIEEIPRGSRKRDDLEKVPRISEQSSRDRRKRDASPKSEQSPQGSRKDNYSGKISMVNEQFSRGGRKEHDNYSEKISSIEKLSRDGTKDNVSGKISPMNEKFSRGGRQENDNSGKTSPITEQFSRTIKKKQYTYNEIKNPVEELSRDDRNDNDNEHISSMNEQFSRGGRKDNDNYKENINKKISPMNEQFSRGGRKDNESGKISSINEQFSRGSRNGHDNYNENINKKGRQENDSGRTSPIIEQFSRTVRKKQYTYNEIKNPVEELSRDDRNDNEKISSIAEQYSRANRNEHDNYKENKKISPEIEQFSRGGRKENDSEKIGSINEQFSRANRNGHDNYSENVNKKISPENEQFSRGGRHGNDSEKISSINEQFSRSGRKEHDNYSENINKKISPENEQFSRGGRHGNDSEKISSINEQFSRGGRKEHDNYSENINKKISPEIEQFSRGGRKENDSEKISSINEQFSRGGRNEHDNYNENINKKGRQENDSGRTSPITEQFSRANRNEHDNYSEKISPEIEQFSRGGRKENYSEKVSSISEQFSRGGRKENDSEKTSPINEQFSRGNRNDHDNYSETVNQKISLTTEQFSRDGRKENDNEKISPITEQITRVSNKLNDVESSPRKNIDEVESNVVYKDARNYAVPKNSVATQQGLLKDKYSETISSKTSSIGTMTNSSDRLTGRNIDGISLEQKVHSYSNSAKPEKETITSKDSVSKDTQTSGDIKKHDHKNTKALQTGVSLSSAPPKKSSKTTDNSSSNSKSADTTVSSSYSSSNSDSTNSYRLCQCCRKSKISIPEDKYYFNENIHHPLCQPCYLTNQHTLVRNSQPYYNHPKHICNCYTMIKTQHVQEIKNTIQQLRALESDQSYCKCSKKSGKKDNNTCGRCNCKLRKEKVKKKPLAYLLKFERGDEGKVEESEKKSQSLEEIVVKIPYSPRHRRVTEDSEKENDESVKKSKHHKTKKVEKKVKKSSKTLQEYLSTNRPNFIESAEQRRKCLIELAYMREERCQKYKQLLAMTSGVPVMQNLLQNNTPKPKPRVFSTNEMKRITAKNYKKLPEVQQKLLDNRDKQIKKANRLLSDIFNKKLRDNVLKGNPTLSTSVSVINLA